MVDSSPEIVDLRLSTLPDCGQHRGCHLTGESHFIDIRRYLQYIMHHAAQPLSAPIDGGTTRQGWVVPFTGVAILPVHRNGLRKSQSASFLYTELQMKSAHPTQRGLP